MKKFLILLFSLNFLICSKSVLADKILKGFDEEDWVGAGLELMDDRQFILTA